MGPKQMWSCIAGGLKIKVIQHRKLPFGTKSSGLIIKGGLKIEGCKLEGLLYMHYLCSPFLVFQFLGKDKPGRSGGRCYTGTVSAS